jgi:hypothetical protein
MARPGTLTCVRRSPERAAASASIVLEALWRSGRVHIYRDLRAELLQLARVVTRDVAVRGPGARLAWAGRLDIPGRGGAREGDVFFSHGGGTSTAAAGWLWFRPPCCR